MIAMRVRKEDETEARIYLLKLFEPIFVRDGKRIDRIEHDDAVTLEVSWASGDDLLYCASVSELPSFCFTAFCAHMAPGYDEDGVECRNSLTVFDGSELLTVPAAYDRWPLVRCPPLPQWGEDELFAVWQQRHEEEIAAAHKVLRTMERIQL